MSAQPAETVGLIAGNGRLPQLVAQGARQLGLRVVAVAHVGETDAQLEGLADEVVWVRVGQLNRILVALRRAGARRAVMVGGIGKVRALASWRPDLSAARLLGRLRSLRDDAVLRAIAGFFEEHGIPIGSPTEFLTDALAPAGHLAGPPLTQPQRADVRLGIEVATAIGRADIGQTVVVKAGNVLAVEASEGTDETIRRAGGLNGAGACVVKLCKPGQDERFDLPTVGPRTLEVMRGAGARVLAIHAGKTLLVDAAALFAAAERDGISVEGVDPGAPGA